MKNHETELIPTAVFDVCDTMYYSNTTHDFIRFVFDKQPNSLKKFVYKFFNRTPLKYALVAVGVATGWDSLKKLNIYLLKGKTAGQLSTVADLFVAEFLHGRQIAETHRLIDEYKRENLRIVLCSSSIEPVIRAVAAHLGIENFVSTSLEFDGEIFTGKIKDEITSRKLEALDARSLSGKIEYAVSDNTSDVNLLLAAKQGIAVTHDRKKQEFWKKYQFEVIDLNL